MNIPDTIRYDHLFHCNAIGIRAEAIGRFYLSGNLYPLKTDKTYDHMVWCHISNDSKD